MHAGFFARQEEAQACVLNQKKARVSRSKDRELTLVALHRRIAPQRALAFLPIGHIGMHEQLEDFSVIGDEQVNQFMHNDELAQLLWQRQQHGVERQPS